jgi:hypothetical protein
MEENHFLYILHGLLEKLDEEEINKIGCYNC